MAIYSPDLMLDDFWICYCVNDIILSADVNECNPNPCLNNGACTDLIGAYTCQCATGFSGNNCEIGMLRIVS